MAILSDIHQSFTPQPSQHQVPVPRDHLATWTCLGDPTWTWVDPMENPIINHMGVSENSVCTPKPNGFADHYPY